MIRLSLAPQQKQEFLSDSVNQRGCQCIGTTTMWSKFKTANLIGIMVQYLLNFLYRTK